MRAIDLFCGCGGLSLGFEKAGIKVLAGIDNWPDALAVYNNNFDHPAIRADLSDIDNAVCAGDCHIFIHKSLLKYNQYSYPSP